MQDTVDTRINQIFLFILQILCDIFWHKYYVPISIYNEQETVQCLNINMTA